MKRIGIGLLLGMIGLVALFASHAPLHAQTPDDGDVPTNLFLPYVTTVDGQRADDDGDMIVTYLDSAGADAAKSADPSSWTRERMLAAQPMPLPLSENARPDTSSAARIGDAEELGDGEPVYVPGGLPLDESASMVREWYPQEWAQLEADGASAQRVDAADALPSLPFISHYVTNPSYGGNLLYDEYPWKTMGALFYTIPGLGDYFCSASVAYDRVVWTAGHCVYTSGYGWHQDMIFVPAYRNGSAPFGVFSMYNMATLNPWIYDTNFAYDIAMVAVSDVNETSLGQTVGWLGSAFNLQPWQLLYNSFGFPSNLGNSSRYLMTCVGDRWLREDANGPDPVAIGCDMTTGSSGGPWVVVYYPFRSGAYNYVNGVNSYGYTGVDLMYSPYFGTNAQNLFNNWGKAQ